MTVADPPDGFVSYSEIAVAADGAEALDRKASVTDYMRSDIHRRSHARIAEGPGRPRPVAFTRFRIVGR